VFGYQIHQDEYFYLGSFKCYFHCNFILGRD